MGKKYIYDEKGRCVGTISDESPEAQLFNLLAGILVLVVGAISAVAYAIFYGFKFLFEGCVMPMVGLVVQNCSAFFSDPMKFSSTLVGFGVLGIVAILLLPLVAVLRKK